MKKLLFVLVVIMLASNASAVNYVANGGFESPVLDDGTSTGTAPDDWWWGGGGSTHMNPAAADTVQPYEGDNMLMTQGSLRAVGQNILIPGGMLANTVYDFTVYANGASGTAFNIDWCNIAVDQDFFPDGSGWNPYITSLDTAANPEYVGYTVVDMEIVHLNAQYGGSDSLPTYFDGVTMTPEPTTMMLLGLGGLLLRRKRRA